MVQAIESMDIQSLAGFNSGKYSFTSFRGSYRKNGPRVLRNR